MVTHLQTEVCVWSIYLSCRTPTRLDYGGSWFLVFLHTASSCPRLAILRKAVRFPAVMVCV